MSHSDGSRSPVLKKVSTLGVATPSSPGGLVCRPDPRRWLVLAVFALISISNGILWLGFGPIVHQVKAMYGITSAQVNLLVVFAAGMYIPLVYGGCYVFERHGLWPSMLLASASNLACAALRTIFLTFTTSYASLVFAQMFVGVASVFFLSLPPLIASTWFPANERTRATALAALSNNLGLALSFGLPTAFVRSTRHTKADFLEYYSVPLAISLASTLAMIMFVPKKPKYAPSLTSSAFLQRGGIRTVNRSVRSLVTSPPFMVIATCTALCTSVLLTISPLLDQILTPFGVTEREAGMLGLVATLSGIVSATAVGALIDRTHQYKSCLVVLNFLATICLSAFVLALQAGWNVLAVSYTLCLGTILLLSAALPISFEYAVEMTYPVPEATSGGFVMFLLSIVNNAFLPIASVILGNVSTQASVYVLLATLVVMLCVATLLAIVARSNLRRVQFELDNEIAADVVSEVSSQDIFS